MLYADPEVVAVKPGDEARAIEECLAQPGILYAQPNYMDICYAANQLCDLNGDGMVNDADLTILWLITNYNRGEVVVP